MKHTPEPWWADPGVDATCIRPSGTGHLIASVPFHSMLHDGKAGLAEANAARIVSCVNAMRGMDPEAARAALQAVEDAHDLAVANGQPGLGAALIAKVREARGTR